MFCCCCLLRLHFICKKHNGLASSVYDRQTVETQQVVNEVNDDNDEEEDDDDEKKLIVTINWHHLLAKWLLI